MWIVKLALKRPYTFVVLAILIFIFGGLAIVSTPTDIFPNIDIPVVSIIWNYNGLDPQDISDRIVSIPERNLTTTVDNIAHLESQSLYGIAGVKVFFQPSVTIDKAIAQITANSQTQLRQLPAGTTPPLIITYSASTVPILELGLSGQGISEQAQRLWSQYHPAPTGHGAGCRRAVSLWRKATPGASGPKYPGLAGERSFSVGRGHCNFCLEPDSPNGNIQNRHERI